jgi:NDP-sugar pyrophosphorylase family protein
MKNKISITINEKVLRDVDSIVDNIFIRNRSQAVEFLVEKALEVNKIAVILAGEGRGNVPGRIKNRYALKIGSQTIIEKAIKKLSDSGFKKVYIVANHEILTKIFNIIGDGSDRKMNIEFINEELEEGSASALKLLKGKVNSTFLLVQFDVIFDDVSINDLWKQHIQEKSVVTMRVCSNILPTNSKETVRFGRVVLQGNKVNSYIEKPVGKNFSSSIFFAGILVAEPEIFDFYGKSLELEVFPELARRGLLGGCMSSVEHLHIHNKEDLDYVRKKLRENKQRV